MVLYKRKPVQYNPRPALYEDQEIWVIEETDEIYTNYDDYLARIEYYKQKRFICEITGHSGLDFFTALKNEEEASNDVDALFPDPLREPILRKVQHSIISRIDNLVDHVFDEFKADFYPGEQVQVVLEGHDRMPGVVREKSRFNDLFNENGDLERPAFVRYFVSLVNKPDHEAIVDNEHIVRERKAFTKQMVRSFLKNSLRRDHWAGAPWEVRERLANEYRINTQIPDHLKYEYQLAQRKMASLKKGEVPGSNILNYFPSKNGLPELKPKTHKKQLTPAQELAKQKEKQRQEFNKAFDRNPSFGGAGRPAGSIHDPHFIQYLSQHPEFGTHGSKGHAAKAPAPPIKYPREDLELELSTNSRPSLKFLSENASDLDKMVTKPGRGITMESVGLLLETWNTLNVYCEVYLLDSFTFDDFVDALQFASTDSPCELLTEVHCAVLKKLVNGEKDQNGRVQINLPAAQENDDESSNESGSGTPTPEPEMEKRTTRGSLRKSDAAALQAQLAVDMKVHNGAEIDQCVKGYGWKARLRKRDFLDGKWIVVVVGLLNHYSSSLRKKALCEELLAKLAPPHMKATEQTAILQYGDLDINLRVKTLQFLCMLSLETPSIRGYMEECTTTMTSYRKEKIDWQRKRKAHLEELKALEEERRALQPEITNSPAIGLQELQEEVEDEEMKDAEEDEDVTMESDDDDVQPIPARSLRRANDRAADRKKRLEDERKRKEKAEIDKANKPTKEARQLEKVLKKIENVKENIKDCESEIAICDGDLRESDCHRTRVLGKDRFWNRYYWYERNAMPYGGLPDSSTADAGYANGLLWVQGPDDMERLGFIDLPDAEQARYKTAFDINLPERKLREEGKTHTFTANDWGFYDSAEDLDKLIGWLNDKGIREVKLRKELQAQREQISIRMENRKQYLSDEDSNRSESAEPITRISTRTKAYVDPAGRRYMKWKNLTALMENGHLHSEPPKSGRRGVARVISASKKKTAPVEDEGRQTRASNKQTKSVGRQGTRYDF